MFPDDSKDYTQSVYGGVCTTGYLSSIWQLRLVTSHSNFESDGAFSKCFIVFMIPTNTNDTAKMECGLVVALTIVCLIKSRDNKT